MDPFVPGPILVAVMRICEGFELLSYAPSVRVSLGKCSHSFVVIDRNSVLSQIQIDEMH